MACCATSPSLESLEDWEDWDPANSSFITHAVAGSLAGAAEHCLIFPLDTIKTFAQTSSANSVKAILSSPTCEKNGKPHSFLRLWRGVSSMLTACVPAHAIYFSIYEQGRQANTTNSVFVSGLTGMAATIGHDLVMCPMDLIKQRLQLGFHSGILDCAKTVFRTEGFSTFYLALPTTLIMNLPYAGISVAVNDYAKHLLNPRQEYNVPAFMASGALAGATAALLTTPLDLVKTRIQTQTLANKLQPPQQSVPPAARNNYSSLNFLRERRKGVSAGFYGVGRVSHSAALMVKSSAGPTTYSKCMCEETKAPTLRKYSGLVDAVKKIYVEEGVKGFSRGAAARMAVHTPSVAISWTTYESAKRLLS